MHLSCQAAWTSVCESGCTTGAQSRRGPPQRGHSARYAATQRMRLPHHPHIQGPSAVRSGAPLVVGGTETDRLLMRLSPLSTDTASRPCFLHRA
jgi:hypothetical protein